MVKTGFKHLDRGVPQVKRELISLAVGAAMLAAPLAAVAADTKGPLTPGSAAGVKQAQGFDNVPLVFWIGAGVVITAAILAVSNSDDNDTPAATTTTTAP